MVGKQKTDNAVNEFHRHPSKIAYARPSWKRASHQYHFSDSRMRTTSDSLWPRITASCLPSKDQPKSRMNSDLKSVSCFPGEPSRCWSQRLSVSPSLTG